MPNFEKNFLKKGTAQDGAKKKTLKPVTQTDNPLRGAQVITFGCRLNAFESSVIEGLLPQDSKKPLFVFNTCAVTHEAERQARQAIRRCKRDNPDAHIVITGCSAQLNPQRFSKMPEVNVVLGNREKLKAASYVHDAGTFVGSMEDESSAIPGAPITSLKAKAFVEIQTGCDHSCTFCVITHARGPSQSVPFSVLKARIKGLCEEGVKEIILTGVDLTSYGCDRANDIGFTTLVKRLLDECPLMERLRLSSLDPAEIDEDFFDLVAQEPRLMPHFHLSVQAGADLILKRMKRRHLRQDVLMFCERLKEVRSDITLGADIIVGFPTETEEHFADTCDLVSRCHFSLLHVFPFSPRPGTPAARMPQLERSVILERAKRLRRLGQKNLYHTMTSFVGKKLTVLLERDQFGYSDHYLPVWLEPPFKGRQALSSLKEDLSGSVVTCVVHSVKEVKGKLHLIGGREDLSSGRLMAQTSDKSVKGVDNLQRVICLEKSGHTSSYNRLTMGTEITPLKTM